MVNTADCGSVTTWVRSPSATPIIFSLGASPSGKALDFDSSIRRFESSRPCHFNDPIAQPVEHLTFNQGVDGSNPSWATIITTTLLRFSLGAFFVWNVLNAC